MKTKYLLLVWVCLVFIACGGSGGGGGGGNDEEDTVDKNNSAQLIADLPPIEALEDDLPDSSFKFMCENNCSDGIHRYYTTSGSAIEIVNAYKLDLLDYGWIIENSGGTSKRAFSAAIAIHG